MYNTVDKKWTLVGRVDGHRFVRSYALGYAQILGISLGVG